MSDAEEIKRLAELRDQGLITSSEFGKRKRQILGGKRPWWMTLILGVIVAFCAVVLLSILVAIFVPIIWNSAAVSGQAGVDTVAIMKNEAGDRIVLSDHQGNCPDVQANAHGETPEQPDSRVHGCWLVRGDSVLIGWDSHGVMDYSTEQFEVVPSYPALGSRGSKIRVDGVATLIGRSAE